MNIGEEVDVQVATSNGVAWIPGRIAIVHPVDKTGDVERYTVVPRTQTMLLAAVHPSSLRRAA